MTYKATYWHNGADTPGVLQLAAANDFQAIDEVRAFVASAYRNHSGASVELADARIYVCRNVHGKAFGHYREE